MELPKHESSNPASRGSPGTVSVKLFHSWRNGVIISYALNCSVKHASSLQCGLDTSVWPRPGRSERVGGARRAQGFPGLAEPWCVCNNKTKDTCLCGWGLCWLVFTGEGCVPLGCDAPSHRQCTREHLSTEGALSQGRSGV